MFFGGVLLQLVANRIIFHNLTHPYSQSERFTFAARRKASHCGAMLHAGKNSRRFTLICGTQINTSKPLLFQEKRNTFAPVSRKTDHFL